ncbi:MAG: ABC transporter ATP-binding protein [Betaproteobacteria bacterium]
MKTLLDVDDLTVEFSTRRGVVKVVDHLSFTVGKGETLSIVGESGCGKSMTALAIMGLVPGPDGRIAGGRILLDGENVANASERRRRELRGYRLAMIFQEPMTSLNPLYSVGEQIAESARLHLGLSRRAAWDRAVEMLRSVQIPEPGRRASDLPHHLSGGMRQRAMIAMALVCEPDLIIADEPTTALDVTVQAQIFELLKDLTRDKQTSLILITHDMGAVAEMADRVVVMYAGRKVEQGAVADVLGAPAHPYTRGLLACRPRLTAVVAGVRTPLPEIRGMVPPLHELGAGCHFAARCPHAMPRCRQDTPVAIADRQGHATACWLLHEERADV